MYGIHVCVCIYIHIYTYIYIDSKIKSPYPEFCKTQGNLNKNEKYLENNKEMLCTRTSAIQCKQYSEVNSVTLFTSMKGIQISVSDPRSQDKNYEIKQKKGITIFCHVQRTTTFLTQIFRKNVFCFTLYKYRISTTYTNILPILMSIMHIHIFP